mmetsp:Transcript_49576/g.82891  ORF Transcript_49576/g.82891 Transcript_49576/m.82891 type:complete len:94 (+) Transcript_49576:42-323(+)
MSHHQRHYDAERICSFEQKKAQQFFKNKKTNEERRTGFLCCKFSATHEHQMVHKRASHMGLSIRWKKGSEGPYCCETGSRGMSQPSCLFHTNT